jgi:hypothetical protein
MVRPILLRLIALAAILSGGCGPSTPESGPGPGPEGEVRDFSGGQAITPVEPPNTKP